MIAAFTAIACAVCVVFLQREQGNAWLQNLLSYSDVAPLPAGIDNAVGVILGYALHKNSSLTEPLKARVRAGVDLFQQGLVQALVFSGSVPQGTSRHRTEADVMQEYAVQVAGLAAPDDRWYVEGESRNTHQNALFSAAIVCKQRWQHLVIVTSPFHQLRSYKTFVKVLSSMECGRDVQVSVAKTPYVHHRGYGIWLDDWMDVWDFARELGAIAKYRMMGYI